LKIAYLTQCDYFKICNNVELQVVFSKK